MHRVRLGLLIVAATALGLGATGCGGRDDFENEPRQPAPIEITASIKDRAVEVSPSDVGAGLATFTIANLSDDPAQLTISGPTDDASNEIPPGGTGNLKATLREGTYEVSAGEDARPRSGELEVGPERASSQNELLLP
jgi:hypothetical protein